MLGTILGDYLGSIYEIIPGKVERKEKSITDDSWLSFAFNDWLSKFDYIKFKHLYNKNLINSNKEYLRFLNDETIRAKKSLVKWYDIGIKYSPTGLSGFSSGMKLWIENEKKQKKELIKRKTNTNGCIMRNSAIINYINKYDLSLEQSIIISKLFAKITHNHTDSINAIKIHTTILYKLAKNELNKESLKNFLEYLYKDNHINLQPIDFWLKEKTEKKFIWDAKTSLDIALSAIYNNNNYYDFINFCCNTKMDSDTYAAIGGTIAFEIFEEKNIPIDFLNHIQDIDELKKYNIFKNNKKLKM